MRPNAARRAAVETTQRRPQRMTRTPAINSPVRLCALCAVAAETPMIAAAWVTVIVMMLGSSSKLTALIVGKALSSKSETMDSRLAVGSRLLVVVVIEPIMRYGALVRNR